MGTTLNEIKLLDILPDNLKSDTESICFAAAFDEIAKTARAKIKCVQLFSRIDTLNSNELALLATELHVDVYDEEWGLTQKRNACKNSIKWHIYKGTPGVLEDYIKTIYGNSELKEWYEYGGLSYHFKFLIEIINDGLKPKDIEKIAQAVEKYKNQRSILDGVDFVMTSSRNINILPLSIIDESIFVPIKTTGRLSLDSDTLLFDEASWD